MSNDSFITITAGTNAVTGTMTIAGETFTVTQAAPK